MATKTADIVNRIYGDKIISSLEVKDGRGRLMGVRVERCEADWVDSPEGQLWGYITERRGHWFSYRPHTTRDGKHYGPVQTERWFATREERDADIARYIADAQKRANKKAA